MESGNKILINLSNHPYNTWSQDQKDAAEMKYGKVIDCSFPSVPSDAGTEDIDTLSTAYCRELQVLIKELGAEACAIVHLMGEFTFTFALTNKLKKSGIVVVASTSERNTMINADGSKQSYFKFIQFREYT